MYCLILVWAFFVELQISFKRAKWWGWNWQTFKNVPRALILLGTVLAAMVLNSYFNWNTLKLMYYNIYFKFLHYAEYYIENKIQPFRIKQIRWVYMGFWPTACSWTTNNNYYIFDSSIPVSQIRFIYLKYSVIHVIKN